MASQEDILRALDVQRFAEARKAEILSLEASIKDSGAQWGMKALPRHLRRRATSHNSYVHKRRPNLKLQQARVMAKASCEAGTPCNRAMRRRKARLQQGIVQSLAAGPNASEGGKPRMLETHVWHAKRMQMTTRWGHKLAEGAPGKGHGSRAFLHTLRHGSTIHDASYWLALEVSGPYKSLISLLTAPCGPEAANMVLVSPEAMQGLRETELVMHHPHSYPMRAITPVKIQYQSGSSEGEALMEQRSLTADSVQHSRLLLSVHAAAHEEALHAISLAAADCDITVRPRYDLQRVEVTGALSDRSIAAALQLATEPRLPSLPRKLDSQVSRRLFQLLQATGGAAGQELSSNAVLWVQVQDPRLAKPIKPLAGATTEPTLAPAGLSQLSDYREELKEARSLVKLLSTEKASRLVWGVGDVPQPLSDAAVSSYRHQQKLAGLLLQGTSPEPLPEERTSCPILMARQAPKDRQAVPRWTLTIPSGWVSHIWQALAYQGARPAGQREQRWTAMQQGEAFFPHDFPDTLAYAQLAFDLAAQQDAHCSLRPKGRCPEGTPHPPRWDLLGASMTTTADSSKSRPLEASASAEEAASMSINPGQAEKSVDNAAEEAHDAVLDESRAQAPPPMDKPGAMDVDEPAIHASVSEAQAHQGHAELQHSSAPAPIYVTRSQRAPQSHSQLRPQCQPGQQPSTERVSRVGTEAGRRLNGSAAREESTEPGAKCLVRVSLRTVGPGVLHEGAALLSLSAKEATYIRRSMLGHKLFAKGKHGVDEQEVPSLKEALRELQHRQRTKQSPEAGQASQAGSEGSGSASGRAAAGAQQARVLIGYVMSEAPRGLLGRGACGVCLGVSLAALRAQQTPGKEQGGVLVAYRSPCPSVLRLAEARIVL